MEKTVQNSYSLVIDDDPIVSRSVEAITGILAVSILSSQNFSDFSSQKIPAAVFVDIHLGLNENGIDLIPKIRQRWPYCPVIVITSDTRGDAVGLALAAGAHDFIRKPLEPKELTARLHARSIELADKACRDTMRFGDVCLDLNYYELKGTSGATHMSQSDARLLQFLALAKGSIVSRSELKRRVWGNLNVSDNALDKRLHEVRKAIRDVGSQIKLTSSYRQGFSLVLPETSGQVA